MLQLQEQYKDLPVSRADDVYSSATDSYERYYKIGDYEAMPSVTTILEMINKPALRDWKMNKALDYLGGKYAKRHWDSLITTPPWVRYPSSPKAQSFRKKSKDFMARCPGQPTQVRQSPPESSPRRCR